MNIFSDKNKEENNAGLPIEPISLYQTCRRENEFTYLRDIQAEVLKHWHDKRGQKDVICKMPTGSGKTLTGLLMLYSKMVEKVGKCLYVCPDNQLVKQTVELAGLYGIPVCEFDPNDKGTFPADFMNLKAILVCSFQKLFNGRSIFLRDNIKLGAVLLDDAHKCVDIARAQATISVSRSHKISERLFKLFSDALKNQAPGSFWRLEQGDPLMLMKVPYWAWMDNHDAIIKILNEVINAEEELDLIFSWNLMSNNLLMYDCYISGEKMEISPIHVPYHEIPSFHEAKHRFILSATFEDDFDLIKDLGISHKSILEPFIPTYRADVGQRLILAPNRIDPAFSDDDVRKFIASLKSKELNMIVLVPSGPKSKKWTELGAEYVDGKNIDQAISKLKSSKGNFMVFVNRYDGVDLHNDLCRILVIDGLPSFSSLMEQYNEMRLASFRNGKKAQIIEQGLGRGTRSGGDYCVTFLTDIRLVTFLGYDSNLNHFTPITKGQITGGLNLFDKSEIANSKDVIKQTIDLCLTQNNDWIEFHKNLVLKVQVEEKNEEKLVMLEFAEIERQALEQFRLRHYEDACNLIVTKIIPSQKISEKTRAWYYQFAAQLVYLQNRNRSNDLQIKACSLTTLMFHPQQEHFYKKITIVSKQSAEIKKKIEAFTKPQDIVIYTNDLIACLQYHPDLDSSVFEEKLAELGEFLGFSTQMPERDMGNGPDVLWALTNGVFLILEAKSEAIHEEISRANVNQLLGSQEWFDLQYPSATSLLVSLQSPSKKGEKANLSQSAFVIDQDCLTKLHQSLRHFVNAFQGKPTNSHSIDDIEKLLILHNFTSDGFIKTYLKKIK